MYGTILSSMVLFLVSFFHSECTSDIDSQVVKGYVLHKGGNECVTVPYPESLGYKGEGYAFHHGRFVMALRNAAKKQEK